MYLFYSIHSVKEQFSFRFFHDKLKYKKPSREPISNQTAEPNSRDIIIKDVISKLVNFVKSSYVNDERLTFKRSLVGENNQLVVYASQGLNLEINPVNPKIMLGPL